MSPKRSTNEIASNVRIEPTKPDITHQPCLSNAAPADRLVPELSHGQRRGVAQLGRGWRVIRFDAREGGSSSPCGGIEHHDAGSREAPNAIAGRARRAEARCDVASSVELECDERARVPALRVGVMPEGVGALCRTACEARADSARASRPFE
jgi:hypothetical protein